MAYGVCFHFRQGGAVMIETLLTPFMLFIVISYVVIALVIFVSAYIYDFKQLRTSNNKKSRNKPLITILISTYNIDNVIGESIKSLIENPYKKLQIIIIDHGSTDSTKKIVKELIKQYPKKAIRLVARHDTNKRDKASLGAFNMYGKGELVLSFNPSDIPQKNTFKIAVDRFSRNDNLGALQFKEVIKPDSRITELFQTYLNLLSEPRHKFNSLTSKHNLSRSTMYKSQTYRAIYSGKNLKSQLKCDYADDAVMLVLAPNTLATLMRQQSKNYFKDLNFGVFQISSKPLPVIFSYILYLALRLHEPALLLLTVGLLSVFLLVSIWGDKQKSTMHKTRYSLLIPTTFVLFYVLSISQLLYHLKPVLWPDFMNPKSLEPAGY